MASETADMDAPPATASVATDEAVGASEKSSQNTEESTTNSQGTEDTEIQETKLQEEAAVANEQEDVEMKEADEKKDEEKDPAEKKKEDVEMVEAKDEAEEKAEPASDKDKAASKDVETTAAGEVNTEENETKAEDEESTADNVKEAAESGDVEMKANEEATQEAKSENDDEAVSPPTKQTPAQAGNVSKKSIQDDAEMKDSSELTSPKPNDVGSPSLMLSRDDMAKMEEDSGRLKFDVITNDGTDEHMIQLTTLKNIFAKQLPKMPKEYIVRLVFDKNHRSMLLLKNGTHVIGGICYRPFEKNQFAEIAFCAINASDQVKGYGTRLMNHLKEYVKTKNITHFLTYADNYAIGYFKKQGFTKSVSMARPNWLQNIDANVVNLAMQNSRSRQSKVAALAVAQGSVNHRSAWPFHEPVDTSVVVDYLDHIKEPVDLQLVSKRIDSGAYISKAAFKADLVKMCDNCTLYNTPDTNYYKYVVAKLPNPVTPNDEMFLELVGDIATEKKRVCLIVDEMNILFTNNDLAIKFLALYAIMRDILSKTSLSGKYPEVKAPDTDDYLELFQQDGVIKEALSRAWTCVSMHSRSSRAARGRGGFCSAVCHEVRHIVELHDEVQDCDNLLAKMQEMLLGFQADLGGISDEIRHLQDESIGMNVKLKNRRETEEKLQTYLDQVAVAPFDLVPSQTAAFNDVEAQLKKLKARAIARIREFLLAKMNEVKKPKTNVQMVQQNTLLPMKYLVTFLADNAPEVEEEFREVYAEAMSKTLVNVFKSYHTGLMKFHEEVAAHLGDGVSAAIDSACCPARRVELPYEAVFRNVQQHLMDSATSEYLFLIEFFKPSSQQENVFRSRDLFMRVFAKTLSLCLENMENYLFTCYDAIGLLLMIRLTYAQRLVMEKRRIPCLDAYFDRVALLLWPRFKAVFDLNLMSVKNAKAKKLGPIDLHPHFVIRRYAEFASSILSLSLYTQQNQSKAGGDDSAISNAQMHENGAGDMVLSNLTVMRDEILSLLSRLRVTSEETSKFEELLAAQREKFVEEELMTYYAKLIQFVRQHEQATLGKGATSTAGSSQQVDTEQIEKIVVSLQRRGRLALKR
ncbi:Bromodomain, conserved site [Phytophthora cactorum]|nr:Bromodomain, conserved site [Phytophthora cactorum]